MPDIYQFMQPRKKKFEQRCVELNFNKYFIGKNVRQGWIRHFIMEIKKGNVLIVWVFLTNWFLLRDMRERRYVCTILKMV